MIPLFVPIIAFFLGYGSQSIAAGVRGHFTWLSAISILVLEYSVMLLLSTNLGGRNLSSDSLLYSVQANDALVVLVNVEMMR
jgi:hypothetical protein